MKIIDIILFTFFTISTYAQTRSFYGDILPILNKYCLNCHKENGHGAMNLSTYNRASSYANMILFTVKNKLMPPWKNDNNDNFLHQSQLKENEVNIIKDWIDSGLNEGIINSHFKKDEASDSFDIVIPMKEHFLPHYEKEFYDQVFVIDLKNDSNLYVNKFQFIPGNSKIVRRCVVFIDTTHKSIELDNKDPKYGYSNNFGVAFDAYENYWFDWVPGSGVISLQEGYYKLIPKNAKLLLKITYTNYANEIPDSSVLLLKTTKKGLHHVVSKKLIYPELLNKPFEIKPNQERYFKTSFLIENTISISSILPLSQSVCTSWSLKSKDPETNESTSLLEIRNWDPHWNRKYYYKKPILLKKGTAIEAIASYKNTEDNENIIMKPTRHLLHGYGLRNEVFEVYFDVSEIEN
jgi:hypothetical protein